MARLRRSLGKSAVPGDVLARFRDEGTVLWSEIFRQWDQLQSYWQAARDDVLTEWSIDHPGTRPWMCWRFESTEQRQRLGGTGTTHDEARGCRFHHFHYGVPSFWVTQDYVRFWPEVMPFNPAEPPVYESQAAYLKRLGLLLPGEEKRLIERDFEPEAITIEPRSDNPADPPRRRFGPYSTHDGVPVHPREAHAMVAGREVFTDTEIFEKA